MYSFCRYRVTIILFSGKEYREITVVCQLWPLAESLVGFLAVAFFNPPSSHALTQALASSPAEIIVCRHRSTSRHWAQGTRKMDGCRRSQVQSSPLPDGWQAGFRVTFLSLTLRVSSRANCHASIRQTAGGSISSNRSILMCSRFRAHESTVQTCPPDLWRAGMAGGFEVNP